MAKFFISLIVHVSLCINVSVAMNSAIHFTILMPANFYKVQLFNTEKQTKQKENKAQPHIIKRIYLKFPSYTDTNQAVMTFYHIFIYSFTLTFAYDDIYMYLLSLIKYDGFIKQYALFDD